MQQLRFHGSFVATLSLLCSLLVSSSAFGFQDIQPRPYVKWVEWEGWGCNLSWWAKAFGNSNDVADILFTMEGGSLNGSELPGLGLTCVRYNVGACTFNDINGDFMVESVNINPTRQMEGFWLNWFDTNPYSDSWDWSVDAHQRNMLLKAKERGVENFELFSVSPLWWMCLNSNPSGAFNGGDNLQFWNYDYHALYLATVAEYFDDNFDIQFDYIAPFNEPIAPWWTGDTSQEGCHHDRDTQVAVIDYLNDEIFTRNLNDVAISASDESFFSHAVDTWNLFASSTKAKIGKLNVHGYQYENGPRSALFHAADGKTLWQSEYGENSPDGMRMAKNIHRDFRFLHPEAWLYWQPLDALNWGMINASNNNGTIGTPNPKFFVFAQFSRHIRPGMVVLDGGETDTIAAYDPQTKKLVLVKTNEGAANSVNFDLNLFHQADGPVRRWQTNTDGSLSYEEFDDVSIADKTISFFMSANSIHTIEIDNVELNGPRNVLTDKIVTTDSVGVPGAGGQNAIDGNSVNNFSRWISGEDPGTHWIHFDLGAKHSIQELRFWSGENGFNIPINNFQFQYRSGNQWINAIGESNNIQSEYIGTFPTVVTSEVRLLAPGEAGSSIKLYEIEALGSLLGDVNLDGIVNLLDIGPFVDLLTDGQYQLEADFNFDGHVNLLDVATFVDILSGN